MSKTSSSVKAKYNAKAYDRIEITVRKDSTINKEAIRAKAEQLGVSVNNYIVELLTKDMQDR